MRLYLYAIGFGVLATLGGLGYLYYKNTSDTIEKLRAENVAYTFAVDTQKKAIEALQQDYEAANQEIETVNQRFAESRARTSLLEAKLAEHEFEFLARSKPGLIENRINDASGNVNRCFEILTGSPLTEDERNARNARDFNSECPWLFPSPPSR
jgi:cell division protein FtsB